MAAFRINETQVTTVNRIEVETESSSPIAREAAALSLRPGVHRFQLVVEDQDGNKSEPAFVDVVVRPRLVVADPRIRPGGLGGIGGLGGVGGPFRRPT